MSKSTAFPWWGWLLLCACSDLATGSDYRYTNITGEQGLSHPTVYGIQQDPRGFLWFATQNGINRFDGYNVVAYPHDPGDPTTPGRDSSSSLMMARDGLLYIGTWGAGVDIMNPNDETFEHLRQRDRSGHLNHDKIQALHQDSSGMIWIGTNGQGLRRYDPSSGELESFPLSENGFDRVWWIEDDDKGTILVGTSDGLCLLDESSGERRIFKNNPADPNSLIHDEVRVILVDSRKRVWLGTQQGICRLEEGSQRFLRYRGPPGQAAIMDGEMVNCLFEDSSGRIMAGTLNGLFVLGEDGKAVENILPFVEVRHVFEDTTGVLWVGTRHEGVFKIQPVQFEVVRKKDPTNPLGLSAHLVNVFLEDEQGRVWIGTRNGLNLWNRENNSFRAFTNDPNDPLSLGHNAVRALLIDSSGLFWVGTYGGGLYLMDRGREQFNGWMEDNHDPTSLSDNGVLCLTEDSGGNFWIGTRKGLNRMDRGSGRFEAWYHDPTDPTVSVTVTCARSWRHATAACCWPPRSA